MSDQANAETTPEYRQSYDAWLSFSKLMRWAVALGAVTLVLLALFFL